LRVAYEVGAIALEMLRIPLQLCLRIAEIVGAAVLAGWRVAWPPLLALARGSRRLVAVAGRAATPGRGALAVPLGVSGLRPAVYPPVARRRRVRRPARAWARTAGERRVARVDPRRASG